MEKTKHSLPRNPTIAQTNTKNATLTQPNHSMTERTNDNANRLYSEKTKSPIGVKRGFRRTEIHQTLQNLKTRKLDASNKQGDLLYNGGAGEPINTKTNSRDPEKYTMRHHSGGTEKTQCAKIRIENKRTTRRRRQGLSRLHEPITNYERIP